MEQTNVSGFKDFVVVEQSYHVNEKLKDIKTIPMLSTDKMYINGELKIVGIDRFSSSHPQYVRIELPTGDAISIPASDHPWTDNFPVFIEDESVLKWHKDLAVGEFYIMLNKSGKKELILIKSIYNERIEYTSCTSRHNRDKDDYFVETISNALMITCAVDYKFISLKDIIC